MLARPALMCVDMTSTIATISSTAPLHGSMPGRRGLQCGLPRLVYLGRSMIIGHEAVSVELRAGTAGGIVAADLANGSAWSASSWGALRSHSTILQAHAPFDGLS